MSFTRSNNLIPSVARVRLEILHGESYAVIPEHYKQSPIVWHPIDQIINYAQKVNYILFSNTHKNM